MGDARPLSTIKPGPDMTIWVNLENGASPKSLPPATLTGYPSASYLIT
jgi:hypothetical protein